MLKRLLFSFVLCSIIFSAYGMKQPLDDISIREEVSFERGHLLKKRLGDVEDKLGQQIICTQGEELADLVDDLKDFHKTKFPQGGKIFVGSPGCGKSTIAKYIPQKHGYNCYFLKSSTISDQFKASGSQNLKLLFESILDDQSPRVLIMDEINALTDKSGNKNDSDSDMATTLWSYLDNCENNKNILWIATTNNSDTIPDALKDRVEIFKFKDPSFFERKNIIKYHLGSHNGLSSGALSLLTFCWEGKSARTIKKDLNKVLQKKERRNLDGNFTITFDDIRQHGLKMEWSRCAKIKSTLYEHPVAVNAVFASGFALGMYYFLQRKDTSVMHADSLKQAADAAKATQGQALDLHRESLAQNLKFHVENRDERLIDGVVSAAGKLGGPKLELWLQAYRSIPALANKFGIDPDIASHALVYEGIVQGLPWVLGGPVAPAVIYTIYGVYALGYVYNAHSK